MQNTPGSHGSAEVTSQVCPFDGRGVAHVPSRPGMLQNCCAPVCESFGHAVSPGDRSQQKPSTQLKVAHCDGSVHGSPMLSGVGVDVNVAVAVCVFVAVGVGVLGGAHCDASQLSDWQSEGCEHPCPWPSFGAQVPSEVLMLQNCGLPDCAFGQVLLPGGKLQQMPLAHACETHWAFAAHVAPFGCGVGVKVGVMVGGGVTVGVAVGVGVGAS